jgi:hypothetical protein
MALLKRVSPDALIIQVEFSGKALCTTCVQEGGFEGPENGPKQRRINNRLLSYRPNGKTITTQYQA